MQYSGIEAFDLKDYDGSLRISNLSHYGDFGLGSFNALDGELIYFDGNAYHATSDGRLKPADSESLLSCAYFTKFDSKTSVQLEDLRLSFLFQKIKNSFSHPGQIFSALRINGFFNMIRLRSVPPQKKPYPAIEEVVKEQALYIYKNVSATVIGFYFPTYFNGLTYSGFHLHFITNDLKHGGHVLDFELNQGEVFLSPLENYLYLLPDYALNLKEQDCTLSCSHQGE
ncbi:acetolactate decarboxylase [Criblamydia sequanensis]|uniref:acetolactate decarboxylase n=1 Tax=Candidatus Criblamydia sequanensis TaxID=340071 RepID=UPI0023513CF8|nr:acetolactate decarboxylase [Criblamydia sequanensis]